MKKFIYLFSVIIAFMTFGCKKDKGDPVVSLPEAQLSKVVSNGTSKTLGYFEKIKELPNGHIIVGGYAYDSLYINGVRYSLTQADLFFIEYTKSGEIVKSKVLNLSGNQYLKDFDIGTDGSIYVLTEFNGSIDLGTGTLVANGYDDCIFKMNSALSVTNAFAFGNESYAFCNKLTVDRENNPIVLGTFYDNFMLHGVEVTTTSGRSTLLVAKFNNTLTSSTFRSFYGDGSTYLYPNCITTDNNSNIYFGGEFVGKVFFTFSALYAEDYHAFFVKMNSSLEPQWDKGGSGLDGNTNLRGLGTDADGNVYTVTNVEGTPMWNGATYDFPTKGGLLQKFQTDGTLSWSKSIKGVYNYSFGMDVHQGRIVLYPGKNEGTLTINRGGPPYSEVLVFDYFGNTIWRKNFQPTGASFNSFYIYNAIVDSEKRIWLSGLLRGNIDLNNNGSNLSDGTVNTGDKENALILRY
ncbi:MAG: hypothetical protein K1X55_09730 [Chitinophagales bacterium]|nr:hypothetical protein [Chitinophagales bacterium]